MWEKHDFKPHPEDIFQERLYCIQWMRPKKRGSRFDYEFRSVTEADEKREKQVEKYVGEHLFEWQKHGWIPDMRIETGYNTRQPIWERGWTHWHHLFNPRQLLVNGTVNRLADNAFLKFSVNQSVNWSSKLSQWQSSLGVDAVNHTFYNQALNAFFNYGSRSSYYLERQIASDFKWFPLADVSCIVKTIPASEFSDSMDIFVTDPPYGDAVKYEEILEFFIAWLRKNPPPEFADWVWDSRRALAIKGEGEEFRQGMIAAYRRMTEKMSDNGIQIIMFTHQSGTIWADMANIVWASGLRVTAAWYVVTETDSALREGSYVKGTVLLVLRKRFGNDRTTRDDLAWEIQEEVEQQVENLTGLNQQAKSFYRDDNLFEDADFQMAGYAAALRVLTKYSVIDGREMVNEAARPRVRGEATFIDSLIEFAVGVANSSLVPHGIIKEQWDRLSPAERFCLKMLDLESRGMKTLDNYQNFAKAFKVRDFTHFMASRRANSARLMSAAEFGRGEMSEGSELYKSTLRSVFYAIMEMADGLDGDDVLKHLSLNIDDFYDPTRREMIVELAGFLENRLEFLRPDEASAARILRELMLNQRL